MSLKDTQPAPIKDFDRERPRGYWGIDLYESDALKSFEGEE